MNKDKKVEKLQKKKITTYKTQKKLLFLLTISKITI